VLVLHDERLATAPMHRYGTAWERPRRLKVSQQRSDPVRIEAANESKRTIELRIESGQMIFSVTTPV
jgi:hypothetical protein